MPNYDPKIDARVKKVLYKPSRVRELDAHFSSIDKLMNLDSLSRRSGAARGGPGSGPDWFIPHTTELSPIVIEAADRCDKIADLLLETSAELAGVDFPARDKQQLRTALKEAASAMRVRAAAWRAPGKVDVQGTMARIAGHERASARAFQNSLLYLHKVDIG
jgi:hypothetical protein